MTARGGSAGDTAPRGATAPKTKRRKAKAQTSAPVYFETRLSTSTCRKCRRPLLIGTVNGEIRHIDKTRLSMRGECAALLAGLRTYETGLEDRNLFRRRAPHITRGLPRFGRILAEHRCEMVYSAEHYDIRDLFPGQGGATCPF